MDEPRADGSIHLLYGDVLPFDGDSFFILPLSHFKIEEGRRRTVL